MTFAAPLQILIIDDDEPLRELMAEDLREHGFEVTLAGDVGEALLALGRLPYDLLLCDVHLPDHDGTVLARRVRREWPGTNVLLMTSFADVRGAVRAMQSGVLDYLTKPVDMELLVQDILLPMAASAPARRLRPPLGERST